MGSTLLFPCARSNPNPLSRPHPAVKGSDGLPGAPVLVLRFAYICPDRQLRRYVVLEPDAHTAAQVMDGARGCGELGKAKEVIPGRRVSVWGPPAHGCLPTALRSSSRC